MTEGQVGVMILLLCLSTKAVNNTLTAVFLHTLTHAQPVTQSVAGFLGICSYSIIMLLRKWHAIILLVFLQTVSLGLTDLVANSNGITDDEIPVSTDVPLPKPDIYSLNVYTDIKFRYATTVVTSRIANPADKAQEVGFTVVLPETAFISGFLMVIDEKVYKAYVKEKEEAKRTYTEAVEQGWSAAHVQQSARDSNQFTVSVNLEPHKKVDFNLTYEQLLTRSLGVYSHVVNINPGQIVRDMSVNVKINESAEIVKLQVPELQTSNEISPDNETTQNELATIERPDPKVAVVRWAPTPEQQKQIAMDGVNGQLTVKYDVDRESNPQQILVDEGYFVHFFAPEAIPTLRKHVVFVLDYSGSMGGHKLEQLRDAMVTILADLDPSDHFSLVLFSGKAAAWYPNATLSLNEFYTDKPPVVEVTSRSVLSASEDNKQLAIDFLKSFNDLGSTNIIDGLRQGIKLAQIGKGVFQNEAVVPEPLVIFLTDGQPNVEIYDPEEIIKEVKKINTDRVAIFSLGFGYGADINFLRKLSLSNNAFARNIYEASDAALQLKNFYKELASPLLSNITFNYLPDQVNSTLSSRLYFPTYFNGSELTVVGKLRNMDEERPESINAGELLARTSVGITRYSIIIGGCHTHCIPVLPEVRHEPSHLEKVWAYLNIQQLMDNVTIQEGQELNNTKKKALDLALQYSFVTPLTSLVVVKPNSTSAVDTEQVRPGEEAIGYGASFAVKSGAIPAAAPMSGMSSGMLPVPHYHSYPQFLLHNTKASVPYSADYDTAISLTVTLDLDAVAWLKNYTAADGTVTIPLDESTSMSLKLGRNETDVLFGVCQVHGTAGSCRHLEYCVLDNFKDNLQDFLPYRCDIPSGFLGVCCPATP